MSTPLENAMSLFRLCVAATAALLVIGSVSAAPPSARVTDGAERYRSIGKRTAPVALERHAEYRAEVGETVTVPLTLLTSIDADAIELEIVADDGLLLSAGRRRVALGAVARGRVRAPMLQVTPLAAGRHYVTVNVFVTASDRPQFRSFAVPFQVGAVAAEKQSRGQTMRGVDGRPLHVLPARERLR